MRPHTNNILTVEGLQISFKSAPEFKAVNNVSFSIEQGKTLAIVGESGSGKSLTALAIIDLLPKSAICTGKILLNNNSPTPHQSPKRGKDISMVFQEPMSSLNPIMPVGKQMAEAIRAYQNISAGDAQQLAVSWFDRVQLPQPATIYSRYPHQLSGGQKQRVIIAMAMCNHPLLLIADEPTTALDATVQREIISLMSYLQQSQDTAMIFITHDLALAAEIANDVAVMYKGDVVEYGSVQDVLEHPRHRYTQALLACRPSPQNKGHRLPVIDDFLSDKAAITQIETITPSTPPGTSLPLLAVNDLEVWFSGGSGKDLKAVNGVSITVDRGTTVGVVGESGSGKSTLARSLVGLVPVRSGSAMFNGMDIVTASPKDWAAIRKNIQMVFQDPYASLNPRMTVYDSIAEPLLVDNMIEKRQIAKEVVRLAGLVLLPTSSLARYPHQFSGGQRQRIGIARALALKPQLLVCDEIVSALDVSVQAQILNLLADLQREFSLTYLFISHDLTVVEYFCGSIIVMRTGKIVEQGNAQSILKQPKEAYTKQLIASMPGEIMAR